MLNASTSLLHFIPYTHSLSLSFSLHPIPSPSFLPDFIRPPSTSTTSPIAPLALFTAKQYTIPSRYISGEHALLHAPGVVSFTFESIRFFPSAIEDCFEWSRADIYTSREIGNALIRKLYEYWVTCYGSFLRGFSSFVQKILTLAHIYKNGMYYAQ